MESESSGFLRERKVPEVLRGQTRGKLAQEVILTSASLLLPSQPTVCLSRGNTHTKKWGHVIPPHTHQNGWTSQRWQYQVLEEQPLTHCWSERERLQALWGNVWWLLIKLNRYLLCDPAIPLLVIYPREMKTYLHKKNCTRVQISIICNSPKMIKNPMSIKRWTNKQIMMYS